MVSMAKFSFVFGFALMLAPAAVAANPAVSGDYSRFTLSKKDAARLQSRTYTKCLDDSQDITATMRECIGAEFWRIDARLNASFKRTLTRLGRADHAKLRNDERLWLRTRLDKCERDFDDDKDGTIWLIEMDDCALQEQMRRTVWIERYR
jgi:uncharacterized protein YecT (DUF1311 family)